MTNIPHIEIYNNKRDTPHWEIAKAAYDTTCWVILFTDISVPDHGMEYTEYIYIVWFCIYFIQRVELV